MIYVEHIILTLIPWITINWIISKKSQEVFEDFSFYNNKNRNLNGINGSTQVELNISHSHSSSHGNRM